MSHKEAKEGGHFSFQMPEDLLCRVKKFGFTEDFGELLKEFPLASDGDPSA